MEKKALKSTSYVSFMTFLSRILGFVRDVVLAHIFGASASFDAFLVAFKIPNFLRRLFAEGAFAQAFVPVLAEYKAKYSQEDTQALMDRVAGNLSLVLSGITILGILGAPLIVMIFAPGFLQEGPFELTVLLLKFTFPYILFISLTALMGGILNTYASFAPPAFTPVLLNIVLIIAASVFSPYFSEPIIALGIGVLIGGVVQWLFQYPFLRRIHCRLRFKIDWQHQGVRKILKLMVPAILGASVMQVNLLVDTLFASFLPAGSLSWLYYSDRLLEFPLGIFGVALATVALPSLSTYYSQGKMGLFSQSIDGALRWTVLIGLPASVGLFILAAPMLSTLFLRGAFEPIDVIMAQKSLQALSVGLVIFIGVKILVSGFYSRQNTVFPVKVAIFAMGVNVIFNFILIGPLQHAGLALASVISSLSNAVILGVVLLKSKAYQPQSGWFSFLVRVTIGLSMMVVMLISYTPGLEDWLIMSQAKRAAALSALILGAMAMYFLGLMLSGLRWHHLVWENP